VITDFAVKRTFGRRPPRLERIFTAGPRYFVTFCTHERQRFLAKNEVHTAFVLFANRAKYNFNVAVGPYVVMPDHVHLFVRGGYNFRLGPWIGALKQALARAGMLSRIRENPVRSRLVKSVEDGPYQGEIVYIDRA
jgi:hypothetical protein